MIFSEYHGKNVAKIKTLDPLVKDLFYSFLNRIALAGIPVLVASARRTVAEQHTLYLQGRVTAGEIVTNADYDTSLHVYGLAMDIMPLKKNWRFQTVTNDSFAVYQQLARIGHDLGIEWGFGMWGFDEDHFQFSGGLTIPELRAGKKVVVPPIIPIPKSFADQTQLSAMDTHLAQLGILPL